MALAFDNATSAAWSAGSTTTTLAHTCSGSDRLLIVGLSVPSSASASGVTYAGVAMTLENASMNGAIRSEIWSLINPASGANNIVATVISSITNAALGAVSFNGADQTTPLSTLVTATGTSNTPSVNGAANSGEIVIDVTAASGGGVSASAGTGQTSHVNRISAAAPPANWLGMSTESGAGGTNTMSWTIGSIFAWASQAVTVKPAGSGGGGSTSTNFLLMF